MSIFVSHWLCLATHEEANVRGVGHHARKGWHFLNWQKTKEVVTDSPDQTSSASGGWADSERETSERLQHDPSF